MRKKKIYVFGEHTDFIKECIRMGMTPIEEQNTLRQTEGMKNEVVVMSGPDVSLDELLSNIRGSHLFGYEYSGRRGLSVECFAYEDIVYEVLGVNDCYSGWEITVINQSVMDYDSLIDLVKNSREYDEIVGGIGLLLKDYYDQFYAVLVDENILSYKRRRKIAKLILTEIAERSEHVAGMEELLDVCRKIFR